MNNAKLVESTEGTAEMTDTNRSSKFRKASFKQAATFAQD
jgi:hypothetical protein